MEEEVEVEEATQENEIRKVYIRNYGNLTLELLGTNDIGLTAYSSREDEELFIPWTSIIFIGKATVRKEIKDVRED